MNETRRSEIWEQILDVFKSENAGPGHRVLRKVVQVRLGTGVKGDEFVQVLEWAVQEDLLTFSPGATPDMSSLALTDEGYEQSRNI
jgi:hypothetical protein